MFNTIIDKNGIADMFHVNNEITKDPRVIAYKFCEYFTDTCPKFSAKIPKPKTPFMNHLKQVNSMNHQSLFMMPTDPDEIRKIVMSMKPKTSCGHDNINAKLLKTLGPAIYQPISININKSLESCYVPADMKLVKIIPIYNSKTKTD